MRSTAKKIIRIITDIFMAIVMVAIFFAIYNFIQLNMLDKKYVNVFGYTLFDVASGSMENTIKINDVIVVKLTNDVKEKDIITYKSGEDFITHRIVKMDGDVIVAKGDANNTADNPIDKSLVLGKVVYIIPKMGVWKKVIMTPKVLISVVVTITLFSFAFSLTGKKKQEKEEKEKLKEALRELMEEKQEKEIKLKNEKEPKQEYTKEETEILDILSKTEVLDLSDLGGDKKNDK